MIRKAQPAAVHSDVPESVTTLYGQVITPYAAEKTINAVKCIDYALTPDPKK